uniref:Uncharacterized protein n=1 Tax=viral metagenome TaxID=1070528 RepID=A0A6C0DZD8_9ZZZZ
MNICYGWIDVNSTLSYMGVYDTIINISQKNLGII